MDKLECVTCFIDIGRDVWTNGYSRSKERYVDNFIKFYSNVELIITVFCDNDLKNILQDRISKIENFKSIVKYENISIDDLDYFKEVEIIRNIQNSSIMKEYIKRDTSNPPEYSIPEYVAMMFAKTEILKIANERKIIKSNNVAWIDFGIGHGLDSYIDQIKNKKLINNNSEKIILFNRQQMDVSEDPFFYFRLGDNVLICGGFYIIPKNLIDLYYLKFKEIVHDIMYKNEIIDDDQTIMSIFASKNKNITEIRNSIKYRNNPSGGDWFPVFEFLI